MITGTTKSISLALFKVAIQLNKLDSLNDSIRKFADKFFKLSSDVKVKYLNILNKNDQKEILQLILASVQVDEILTQFVYLLIEINKISLLEDFLCNWNELQKEFQGYEKIEIVTAEPLNDDQEKLIEEHLNKIVNNKFFLVKKIDEKIIAGLIVRSKNFEFNDSILYKLNNISKSIKGALNNE